MLEFDPHYQPWSGVMFWFVTVNAIATLVFCAVVIVGGAFDLRYLFKALREAPIDESDDGRVEHPPTGDHPAPREKS